MSNDINDVCVIISVSTKNRDTSTLFVVFIRTLRIANNFVFVYYLNLKVMIHVKNSIN